MKKISIIIAVYNVREYLRRCLDSVISQEGDDIEIIIVDDGSTDDSLEICKKYQELDRRIEIIHQDNKGLNCVRNVGYDNSIGDYIWHIDGDDYIEKNSIKILRPYLYKYDIICFNYNKIKGSKQIKYEYKKDYDNIRDKYILAPAVVWNKIFKREVFANDRFPLENHYNDIYIIPYLVYKTENIIFIDEVLYNYVQRLDSLSLTRPVYLDDYIKCLDHVYEKVSNKSPDAAVYFYVNHLTFYNYVKEILGINKYDYRKNNKMLKSRFPKYYNNKYYNNNLFMKIYIRLIYYDMIFLVNVLTFLKIKVYNKFFK